MRNVYVKILAGLAIATTTACFGFGVVTIVGSLGGRTINPQTIAAYLDANQYQPSEDGTKLVLKPRDPDKQTLVVRLDGANFDPTVDARFLPVEETLRIFQERGVNGFLNFRIERAGFLANGNELKKGPGVDDAASDKPKLSFRFPGDPGFGSNDLAFAAAEMSKEEQPAELTPVGSQRTITVKIDEFGKKSGEVTKGKVTLEWKKKTEDPGKDPANALEGKIEIEFEADMIGERVGECNNNSSSQSLTPYGDEYDLECNDFSGG